MIGTISNGKSYNFVIMNFLLIVSQKNNVSWSYCRVSIRRAVYVERNGKEKYMLKLTTTKTTKSWRKKEKEKELENKNKHTPHKKI